MSYPSIKLIIEQEESSESENSYNSSNEKIKKVRKDRIKKDDLFKEEQLVVLDKMKKLIEYNEVEKSYFGYIIEQKKAEITGHFFNEIKKYYHSNIWYRCSNDKPRSHFQLIKNVFKYHKYKIAASHVRIKLKDDTSVDTYKYLAVQI